MICLVIKVYILLVIIKVLYLFINDLEKINCILFLIVFYCVCKLWIKSCCLYVFEWFRIKFDCYFWLNKIKFYWIYFGNKKCMINFNCVKVLVFDFVFKYVCVKFFYLYWISLYFLFVLFLYFFYIIVYLIVFIINVWVCVWNYCMLEKYVDL